MSLIPYFHFLIFKRMSSNAGRMSAENAQIGISFWGAGSAGLEGSETGAGSSGWKAETFATHVRETIRPFGQEIGTQELFAFSAFGIRDAIHARVLKGIVA
jgi:hypothetical protein